MNFIVNTGNYGNSANWQINSCIFNCSEEHIDLGFSKEANAHETNKVTKRKKVGEHLKEYTLIF